jgi:flagellar protein FliO/FliZ
MPEFETFLRFGAALAGVLALILGLAWIARLRQPGAGGPLGALTARGRRRLAVVETLPLDARTRLMLVRCDDQEHLVAVGPAGVSPLQPPRPAQPANPPETRAP